MHTREPGQVSKISTTDSKEDFSSKALAIVHCTTIGIENPLYPKQTTPHAVHLMLQESQDMPQRSALVTRMRIPTQVALPLCNTLDDGN